jgi:hypothetical protein
MSTSAFGQEIIVISDNDSDSGDTTVTEPTIGSPLRRRRQGIISDNSPPAQRRCLRSLMAEPQEAGDEGIYCRWRDQFRPPTPPPFVVHEDIDTDIGIDQRVLTEDSDECVFWDAHWSSMGPPAPIEDNGDDGDTEGGDEDSGDEEEPNSDDEAAIDDEDLSSQCDTNASYAPSESGDSSPSVSSSSSGASSE